MQWELLEGDHSLFYLSLLASFNKKNNEFVLFESPPPNIL